MRSVQFRFLSTRDASFSHFAAMSLSRAFASGAVLARFSQSAARARYHSIFSVRVCTSHPIQAPT
jgi:hypothetical protein